MGLNSELGTYTITVYELQQNGFDFGLDKYPIFDENYRATLNDAILQTYLTREICFSNPALWRQKLQNRMNIIMRNKYNALYKAKQMEFNPLYTMELYETYSHTIDNKGQNSATGQTNTTTNGTSQNTTTNKNSADASNVSNEKNSADASNKSNETNQNTTDSAAFTNSNSLGLSSQFPSEEMTEDDLTSNLFVDSAQKNKGSENSTNQQNQNSKISSDSITNQNNNKSSNSVSNQSANSEGTENSTTSESGNIVNSNSGTNQNNMNETYSKKTIGSASDLTFAHAMTQFKEYVDKFNLDQLVCDELKDLFITVW